MSNVLEITPTMQVLEIQTEQLVAVISILTCHGYRVTASRVPGRHVLTDEIGESDERREKA